ncbi:MAG TPA: class I SAM-dependent methyltransferase [Acidimicrobiales bacterium]|nr:class I SAM-dependent methyltransferase [Acidimicrobiales bacterium]
MSARYDLIAAAYASGEDDLSSPAVAALLDLAGPLRGQRVLDLACGHGPVARDLARSGAHVVGLDISTELIKRARQTEARTSWGIEYEIGDVADPDVLAGTTFDAVVCNFGMSDIDDIDGACATVARLLRPGGRFVFSILHPCFGGTASVCGSWPSNGTYYDERWWRADRELSTLRREVGANHRTLSTYLNTLTGNGLQLEATAEPRPEESWTIERPEAAVQPVYLVVACRRPLPSTGAGAG